MDDTTAPSPSSSSSSRNDTKHPKSTLISLLTDDLLHNILSRLPAPSFAAAACVSSPWNRICNRVLSRPKLASALSLHPSPQVAVSEVVDKVLSEPIRPDFAVVSIGSGYRLYDVVRLVSRRLGTKTPVIISTANGIIGRDALNDELIEVKWTDFGGDLSDDDGSINAKDQNFGIVLTVGFMPGLKVDVIPLLRSTKKPRDPLVDKFVADIIDFANSPVGIILFGEGLVDMKPVINVLDYALPKETVIVGDERGRFLYRSREDSRNLCGSAKYFTDAVALTFARDRVNAYEFGDIRFHAALSNGLVPVGPRYRAVSVRINSTDHSSWLTAKVDGQRAVLDGQRIMDDINDALRDHDNSSDIYIGVTKRRNCSIGSEKPRLVTSMSFHGVVGWGDQEYLYVSGVGIRTHDHFQFYHSDPNTALTSVNRVSNFFSDLKSTELRRSKGRHSVFGGFVFSCYGRGSGDGFFDQPNIDSSPLHNNFPQVPLAGIFCGGEIGRCCAYSSESPAEEEDSATCCLHVYSTVYLAMSYTPPAPPHGY